MPYKPAVMGPVLQPIADVPYTTWEVTQTDVWRRLQKRDALYHDTWLHQDALRALPMTGKHFAIIRRVLEETHFPMDEQQLDGDDEKERLDEQRRMLDAMVNQYATLNVHVECLAQCIRRHNQVTPQLYGTAFRRHMRDHGLAWNAAAE